MHDDDHLDSPEVREAINATLRDILSTDTWGSSTWDALIKNLHDDFDIETDLLELAQNAPCLVRIFQLGALARKGVIGRANLETVSQIIRKLVHITFNAEKGDDLATNQLQVLHKVAHPFNYELPATVIEKLAESYHMSPHLARAWSVRDLMIDLSFVVEPTSFDRSVLQGPVKLTRRDLHTINRKLHATAERHIKKGTTLLSLATSIYIEELEKEGITLDPRQIKADLRKLKEWEPINLKDDPSNHIWLWNRAGEYPPASIPAIPIYSDGWKRLWRRGDKKGK